MQTLASPGMGALQSGQTFRLDGVSALNIFLPLPAAIRAKPIRASRIPKDNPKNGDCQNRIAASTISAMPIFVNMVVVSFNSSRLNRNSARYGPPQLDAAASAQRAGLIVSPRHGLDVGQVHRHHGEGAEQPGGPVAEHAGVVVSPAKYARVATHSTSKELPGADGGDAGHPGHLHRDL